MISTFIAGVVAVIVCLVASVSSNVYANVNANWSNSSVQKALLQGLVRCYTTSSISNQVDSIAHFSDFSKLIIGGKSEEYVALPSGLTLVGDNNVSCKELFMGYRVGKDDNSFPGLFNLSGKQGEGLIELESKVDLLEGMGYERSDGGNVSSNKSCIYYTYNVAVENRTAYTKQVCVDNDVLSIEDYIADCGDGSGICHAPIFYRAKDGTILTITDETMSSVQELKYSGDWEDFKNQLNVIMSGSFSKPLSTTVFSYELLRPEDGVSGNDMGNAIYRIKTQRQGNEWKLAADKAISYLSNGIYSSASALRYSDQEKVAFYIDSIRNWFFNGQNTGDWWVCGISDWSLYADYVPIAIGSDGMKNNGCGINVSVSTKIGNSDNTATSNKIYGFNGDYFDASGNTKLTLVEAIGEINTLVGGLPDDMEIIPSVEVLDDRPTNDTCASSGAAGSLGWIVCPILEWMSNSAEDIYSDYVEESLQIQPTIFTDSQSNMRKAWETFRNFANILFIIILLFVIFSQLTGFGIDNYGIKKILPRLIISAILINISFLICEICVDLSNIVGNGLRSLFDGLATSGGLKDSIYIDEASKSVGGGGGVVTSVALFAGLYGVIGLIVNPAILLTLLVSAFGVLISILFLFVLLAGRKAAIVVLTVIAPIALILFMLPNTKKYFDKWLKLWGAMLLLYPICGLLVGGGNYVSKLLLTIGSGSDGVFEAFTAMIVGVIPIFFIPSVLKGSFSAMGNIGTKISGIGSRLRGGATSQMRNSELYKGAQERGLERRTRLRAGLNREGKESVLGGIRNEFGIGRRGMARARAQYLKNQDARNREASLMGVGYGAAQIGLQKKAEKDEIADYMTLINNQTRNGENTERLYQKFDEYMAANNKAGAVAVARIAGRRKDTADDFLASKITGVRVSRDRKGNLVETMSNVSAGYNKKTLSSVMKEISTGESSGMYRSSSPLGFEFAAQFNREYREDDNGVPVDGAGEVDYNAWRSATVTDGDGNIIRNINTDRSMSNYVTDSRELVGIKNSSLREMNKLIEDGAISDVEIGRLRRLANDTINNKDTTGVWDTTKAENIYRMAGRLGEYDAMTVAGGANGGDSTVATPPAGAAREGEVFIPREQGAGQQSQGAGGIQPASEGALNEYLRNRNNGPQR